MFVAKLVILNKDGGRVITGNHNEKIFRSAVVTTANLHFGNLMPRVGVFSWDESNIGDIEAFKKFFDEFIAPEDYSFVMSIDDEDKVRDGGILKGVAEIRKVVHLNGHLVAAKTGFSRVAE